MVGRQYKLCKHRGELDYREDIVYEKDITRIAFYSH